MNKYKISINDKNYIIYAESHEDAVKKLKDANIANTETILQKGTELIKNIKEDKNVKVEFETSYSTSNIYNKNNPEKAKLSISIMYEPDEESGWYIIEAYIKFEDNKAMKLGLRQSDTKQGAIQALREIITKARKSIKDSGISDYQPKEISYKRIEDLPLKSRQELQNSKNKEATLLSIEGNIEDIINAANPEIKGDLQRIGSKILNDLRKQFKITDNKIKDDNNSEYRKELAKWQDLYINKKLITSSELSEKAKELKQKYNIKDEKLTSKQIIEKAKSFGGQAKQNGATGVLGISITSPQGSDEFAEWLEKNNIHYNSDGRQYYVEIQDCEIGDKLIQSGSEEAFKKNIATEIRAGKDPKQAAAIAYSVQRENDSTVKDKGRYKIKHPVRNEYLSVFGTFVEPSSNYIITFASEDEARNHYKRYGDKDININIVKDSSTIKDAGITPNDIKVGAKFYNLYSKNKAVEVVTVAEIGLDNVKTNSKFYVINEKTNTYEFESKGASVFRTIEHTIESAKQSLVNTLNEENFIKNKPNIVLKDSSIKDSSDYIINYRNSYTGERNKETIKANSAIEAIKKFSDAVALRGWGTRNIDIISISPNDGYVRLYGSLQALLTSKEFRDCNLTMDANPLKEDFYQINSKRFNKIKENINLGKFTKESALQYIEKMWGSKEPGSANYLKNWIKEDIKDCAVLVKDSNELDKYIGKRLKSSNDFLTFVKIASNNNYKWSNNSDGTMNVVIPSGRYNIKFKYDREPDKNGDRVQVDKITKISDAEPKNWIYIMYGSDNREYKVDNLTKAEAEHLLKNNKLLGYSGKIYETVIDNDTNNTNKILDSGIVVAKSLDELISKIKSWDGETTTNYILSPKSSGWYFDYFITMGYKYSYYTYIKKTAHGRHDNPNVDISKQNIDKTVTAKTAQELIDQVVRILK